MSFNDRILVVDDNPAIHDDFDKILAASTNPERAELDSLTDGLFADSPAPVPRSDDTRYTVHHAASGEDALKMVAAAEGEGQPYALAFMDVRMPAGLDGIETIERIWKHHAHIEMVICTAHSDYSWTQIIERLGNSEKLQLVRKPVDVYGVRQIARVLVNRWNMRCQGASESEIKQFARFPGEE
jgi:CheY-like chemotaxis protein